jgi:Tfp pilus assembly protein PilO
MAGLPTINYKTESNRYRYYYRRLVTFYQKPITQVSSAVLFTLALIIFFAVFAIKPTLETIGQLITKIEAQEVILEQAKKKTAALAAAQENLLTIESALPVLDEAIPSNYQVQQITRSIESLAGNLSLSINNLRVSSVTYPIQASANPIEEIAVNISFDAAYPEAKTLIIALSKLPRLLTLETISFTQPEFTGRVGDANSVQVNIQAKAYYAALFQGTLQ